MSPQIPAAPARKAEVKRLAGQTFVVTGASRGIGRSIATRLAGEGARLVIGGRDRARLESVSADVRAGGGECLAVPGDLAQADAALAFAKAAEDFGPVAGLVNNAGIAHRRPLAETDEAMWRETLDVNLTAPYLMTRALLPGMLARRAGRVVNVGSISSVVGTASLTAYCASKWGLLGFTRALAKELDGTGVSVTAVLPGSTDTEMLKGSGFSAELTPEQVGRIVAFVVAFSAPQVNGAVFELFD